MISERLDFYPPPVAVGMDNTEQLALVLGILGLLVGGIAFGFTVGMALG